MILIWEGGRIVPESALMVSVADRSFEHGLGLFETMRTWKGHATLLARHLARLRRSAEALALPLEPPPLPDATAITALLRANQIRGDALLRLTLTGGLSESASSVLWMRAAPAPSNRRRGGATLVHCPWRLDWYDPLARHKTLNYWTRRLAFEQAQGQGADEALLSTPDGRVWEGSRTSLFVVKHENLITPSLDGPIVPGVMRAAVLEHAAALGLETREADLTTAAVDQADEVFLTNAVRGIVAVGRTPGRALTAPGPWTRRLWQATYQWLQKGGTP